MINTETPKHKSQRKPRFKYKNENLIELYHNTQGNYSQMAYALEIDIPYVGYMMKHRGLRDKYPPNKLIPYDSSRY